VDAPIFEYLSFVYYLTLVGFTLALSSSVAYREFTHEFQHEAFSIFNTRGRRSNIASAAGYIWGFASRFGVFLVALLLINFTIAVFLDLFLEIEWVLMVGNTDYEKYIIVPVFAITGLAALSIAWIFLVIAIVAALSPIAAVVRTVFSTDRLDRSGGVRRFSNEAKRQARDFESKSKS